MRRAKTVLKQMAPGLTFIATPGELSQPFEVGCGQVVPVIPQAEQHVAMNRRVPPADLADPRYIEQGEGRVEELPGDRRSGRA